MVKLEYFNGKKWIDAGGPFGNEFMAWVSLGDDYLNYRTVDTGTNKVITTKLMVPKVIGRNSKKEILKWIQDALEGSRLCEEEKRRLSILGQKIIYTGGWRGDVSTMFSNEGYNTIDIPDLYV